MIKDFKSFINEDFSELTYSDKKDDAKKTEAPAQDTEQDKPVKEEEEQSNSLTKTLDKCITSIEEIVRLFEKNDKKLIDLILPILDLCQTNLNFQEKNSEGKDDLLESSKKIIKSYVDKLKKDYANNDLVSELVKYCDSI